MNVELPEIPDGLDADSIAALFRQIRERLLVAFGKVFTQGGIIVIGNGQTINGHFSGTKTWDPPNVLAATAATTTVTVKGVSLNARVDEVVASFNKDLQGMVLTGYVSAPDTVTVVLFNPTAAPIDLASGTLRASVWRH